MESEIAVIMAAGLGTRMLPLTRTCPKPLIPILGKPMIETMIEGLCKRSVRRILIVVGYMKEKFEYLAIKYENVELIENKDYLTKNNISSIHSVCGWLGQDNCFICEADIYVADDKIFEDKLNSSCYFGRMTPGYSGDWLFDVKDGRIESVHKGGTDRYNMTGIAYFLKKDAAVLRDAVTRRCKSPGYEELYWDQVVDGILGEIAMEVHPVSGEQLMEFDTLDEIAAFDIAYRDWKE